MKTRSLKTMGGSWHLLRLFPVIVWLRVSRTVGVGSHPGGEEILLNAFFNREPFVLSE